MAATATIDEATLVSKPDTSLLYMSRRSGLRLTLKARYPIRDPITGQPNGHTPGLFVGFRDGVFRIPPSGPTRLVDTLDGGELDVEDASTVVAELDKHRLYGNREEGFWRVDPTAPPVSQDELQALMDAATNFDVDTLQRLVDEERDGWGRDAIIGPAETALVKVRGFLEQAEADKAKQEPKAK